MKSWSGWIKRWSGSGKNYKWFDVSTRNKRQQYCRWRSNRAGVYCRNNLDGDAMRLVMYDCGTRYCTVDDCADKFEQSDAWETCQGPDGDDDATYRIIPRVTDRVLGRVQKCQVTASCKLTSGGSTSYQDKTILEHVFMMDRVVNCLSTWHELKTQSCR